MHYAAILDMVDALTMVGHVNSPVASSESPVFRRKFSSVYDALVHGEVGPELQDLFHQSQANDWETIAGYEVHAVDATPQERMAAETLADRGVLKAQKKESECGVIKSHFGSNAVRCDVLIICAVMESFGLQFGKVGP